MNVAPREAPVKKLAVFGAGFVRAVERADMAQPWFRLYVKFATDPKMQTMSEQDQRRWIMVLCLRGSDALQEIIKFGGETELARNLNIPAEELAKTKAALITRGLISESWDILTWDDKQYTTDSSKERVQRFRASQRNDSVTLPDRYRNVTVTKCNGVTCNDPVTAPDTDTDTENSTVPPITVPREKPSSQKSAPAFDEIDVELTNALRDLNRAEIPDWDFAGKPEKHYHDMHLLRTHGHPNNGNKPVDVDRIRAALAWLASDSFWIPNGNVQSVRKFRDQFSKFESSARNQGQKGYKNGRTPTRPEPMDRGPDERDEYWLREHAHQSDAQLREERAMLIAEGFDPGRIIPELVVTDDDVAELTRRFHESSGKRRA